MSYNIQKAAVIGAGVMGAGIAAHLANVGISVMLLDIVPKELTAEEKAKLLTLADKAVRNRNSNQAIKRLVKQKPAPLMMEKNIFFMEAGNIEDDLHRLSEVDWIIEAVVEDLSIKKRVLQKVDDVQTPGTIVSSNTSGISVHSLTEGRSQSFKTHFLGTHFFNPPRYLKLLEVIPSKHTNPNVLDFMKWFGEETLGKGVVEAKDTPNFIANRIGTFGLLVTLREMEKRGLSVKEVDSLTGPLIGRPKSATFRTLDMVGIDTFLNVVHNMFEQVEGEEKESFKPPCLIKEMVERGRLGSKVSEGFYKKEKFASQSTILELNLQTQEYEAVQQTKSPAVDKAKQIKSLPDRLKYLSYGEDQASRFVWNVIKPLLLYSAEKRWEIANDITMIDHAMKWGFGWELGPFELWDAIGVASSVKKMEAEGETVPAWVKEMVEQGFDFFYQDELSYYHNGEYRKGVENKKVVRLRKEKQSENVIMRNKGASLIDIGDEVACLSFHSPNDAIGIDMLDMIEKSVDEVEKSYKGLVLGSGGKNFSVGANLMMILMEAQEGNYLEIDMIIRKFQRTMSKIRYASRPVVAAPHGMTLGGGAEICLPAASVQAGAETYMGLVEAGVGLLPAGGGNKELYLRHLDRFPVQNNINALEAVKTVFESIASGNVSTSAQEAKELGYLGERDAIIFNGDHTIFHAKEQALHLFETGYRSPRKTKIFITGETGYAAMKLGANMFYWGGVASRHDLKIADKIAYVLAGGRVPCGTLVDEEYLLELEREAFLSLVGEPKTQQRIQHMLTKRKPLRN